MVSPARALSRFEARLARWLSEVSAEAAPSPGIGAESRVDTTPSWEQRLTPRRVAGGAWTPRGSQRREGR